MTTKNIIIPEDYNDLIYRGTYFFLGKIAHKVPRSITPNQITLAAFISALLGTLLLFLVQSPMAYLYWLLFNFIWYVLDALDGIHARLTQQTSEFGAFLDHALDNIYFLFMLTAFTIKFDLAHALYIYILLLRLTAAIMVFTVQCHTKRLYLSKFSGGLELFLFSLAMILSYFFPDFNPLNHTTSAFWTQVVNILSLEKGMFMKLILMVYLIGIPITFILQFRFVKKESVTTESPVL